MSASPLPPSRQIAAHTDNQLLQHIADGLDRLSERVDEMVKSQARVQQELLGEEGDRESGLIFRFAALTSRVLELEKQAEARNRSLRWILGVVGAAAIGDLVVRALPKIGQFLATSQLP